MATYWITVILFLLSASFLLFFTFYWLTPISDHHLSPSSHHPTRKDLKEAPPIFKFNRTEDDKKSTIISNNETSLELLHLDDFRNIFCNLEPAWPVLYEKDVVMLSEKNFSDFLAKNRYVMVLFYMFWCPSCRQLAPEYAAAAKMLKDMAELAVVDAYVETELRDKYNVPEYPTMYLFVNGGARTYQFVGARKRDAITTWVKRKMALPVYNLTTMDEAIYTLNAESRLVLGYLDSLEGSESEELAAASKLQRDINFYQTAKADVAELFNINRQIKRPALTLLQTVSGQSSIFRGQFTRSSIADFVSKSKHPLVVNFTLESAELIFQNPMKQLWLFAPACGSEEVISTFEEAAKAFRGKLLFVYLDINGKGVGRQVAHDFGVTGDAPIIIAYRQHDAKKLVFKGELTLSSIKSFGEDFLEDELLRWSDSTPNSVLELPSHSRASHALRFHHIN